MWTCAGMEKVPRRITYQKKELPTGVYTVGVASGWWGTWVNGVGRRT